MGSQTALDIFTDQLDKEDKEDKPKQTFCIACEEIGTNSPESLISGHFVYRALTDLSKDCAYEWTICDTCLIGLALITLGNMTRQNNSAAHMHLDNILGKAGSDLICKNKGKR